MPVSSTFMIPLQEGFIIPIVMGTLVSGDLVSKLQKSSMRGCESLSPASPGFMPACAAGGEANEEISFTLHYFLVPVIMIVDKRRKEKKTTAPSLARWGRQSGHVCFMCGRLTRECLHANEPNGREKYPCNSVMLCASCLRIFDKCSQMCEPKLQRRQ